MIVGIGNDVCSVERLEQSISRTPKLSERLFHPNELGLPARSLAARFAAKEAITKAIGDPAVLTFNEVEIVKNERGKPSVSFMPIPNSGSVNWENLLFTSRYHTMPVLPWQR